MDPLSVSSGVVGLLAFAMQMATVATQVKQVVDQFKSAPKEIEELLQRLTLLQTMCELVKVKVAGVPGYTGGSSSGSLDAISTALLQCQSKMEDLSRTLSATGLNPSQARIPLSKSEAFSRLRFVLRREKVKSMVQDVDHVISLLHLVLTMDTWMTTVSLSQTPGLSHPDNVQSSVSSLQDVPSVETQSALPRPAVSMSLGRVEGAPRKKRHSSRNMGLINWTTVETWAEGQDDAFGVPPERSGNITLRLPFTSVQLDLHYTQFMGTPSYALNINHNIDPYSGFGYQITELFWERDLLGLKKLLSDRKLSIYSVLGDTSLFYLSEGT
ncbi:hypothetical protein VM1G_00319 [Cytospora mali]|uniref:Azaphilone pigments biosynthesis cluster protein L N-terminal domain-containing protein n=1 Tax=Cytospora mali TaxID=578113 RepID=A0A194VM11_CYTMA|nr:hypothetical protein VM1G_00319 [Valsa mali]